MKKLALRFIDDNNWVDVCEYKNCRQDVEQGYVVCKKHIGQNKRDFDKKHITIGNWVFRADKKTASIFNN